MQSSDFCIAGGGIIGLTLALELHRRGATVTVVERDRPLGQASQAAAGMLAADDPDNPAPLQPLSRLSLQLYPELLDRLEALSGQRVPFQTTVTYQQMELDGFGASPGIDLPGGPTPAGKKFVRLEEHSLDPRQLAPALLAAVQATPIRLLEGTAYEAGRHKGQAISTLGPW